MENKDVEVKEENKEAEVAEMEEKKLVEGKAEKQVEQTKTPSDEKEIEKSAELPKTGKAEETKEKVILGWKPRTKLGCMVKEGEIKDIDELLDRGLKILESEAVDMLIDLKVELLAIGQSKGKFGGGKRRIWRQTQKKTAEGNVPTFACMAVAGDSAGHVGIGYGKSKETLPAKEKATRKAKLNIMKIKRGCGSFDCGCKEEHSIPLKVKGKCGSSEIILMPAPKGTGLAVEDECKKILALAGIKDAYSKTFGQTRTKINLLKACFNALKKIRGYR